MANSLDRQIQENEIVILSREYVVDSVTDLRFKCKHGFGLIAATMGTGIYGEFFQDSESSRIEGYMIDPVATAKYQAQYGKLLSPTVDHNGTIHAVRAGGSAKDGSLYGFNTYCGLRVLDDQNNPDWREVENGTITCKRCMRSVCKHD